MTGQIPPYGENFKLEQIPGWHPELAHRAYVLKKDSRWFIRADKTSKRWNVFCGTGRDQAAYVGKTQPTMFDAMKLLLDGIEGGFYKLAEPDPHVHANDCGLQGSGLNKHCTCHVDAVKP